MGPVATCDGSTIETTFVVGPDLVEFDRPDLPIYATPGSRPESRWADAGLDTCPYGAPLDRLFGEPGDVFVSGMAGGAQMPAALATAAAVGEDPLVTLASLSDGLILPTLETPGDHPAPEVVTIFDAGIDSFAAVHLHVDGTWDGANDAWGLDYGA